MTVSELDLILITMNKVCIKSNSPSESYRVLESDRQTDGHP